MVNAIILAGGKAGPDLEPFSPNGFKSLIPLGGVPMVKIVVDAVGNAKGIDKIAVVGPEEFLRPVVGDRVEAILPDTGSLFDNLLSGLEHFKDAEMVFIGTCDIPLLKPEHVDDFLELCAREPKDIAMFYSTIPREVIDTRAPLKTHRTYAFVAGVGQLKGGNIMLMNPNHILPSKEHVLAGIAYRKKPIKLAAHLGFMFIIKFLLKRITLPEIETKVSTLLKCKVKSIIVDNPEIGIDLDKLSDYEALRDYFDTHKPA